ncbi:MAG: type II 3-dehydroquinate dehydratase [Bacteroidota bacterium]
MNIAIINGPNLNLLGSREPEIYGKETFEDFLKQIRAKNTDITIHFYQSNVEGEIINALHNCIDNQTNGIILNAGAYTHTSIAIADALTAIKIPCIEVHISNVLAREDYRKTSYIAEKCIGSISGLGLQGYELALQYFTQNRTK